MSEQFSKPGVVKFSFRKLQANPAHMAAAYAVFCSAMRGRWSAIRRMVHDSSLVDTCASKLSRWWRSRVHLFWGYENFQALRADPQLGRKRRRRWVDCWPSLFDTDQDYTSSVDRQKIRCNQHRLCPWCRARFVFQRYLAVERMIRDFAIVHPNAYRVPERFRLALLTLEFKYRPGDPGSDLSPSQASEALLRLAGRGAYWIKNPISLFRDSFNGRDAFKAQASSLSEPAKKKLMNGLKKHNKPGLLTKLAKKLDGKLIGMMRYVDRYPSLVSVQVPDSKKPSGVSRRYCSDGVAIRVDVLLVGHQHKTLLLPELFDPKSLQKEVDCTGWKVSRVQSIGFDTKVKKKVIRASKHNLAFVMGRALSMPAEIWYAPVDAVSLSETASRGRRNSAGRLSFAPPARRKLREKAALIRAKKNGERRTAAKEVQESAHGDAEATQP